MGFFSDNSLMVFLLVADIGVNSILEYELISNSNSGIAYLKKKDLELINLELEFATKNLIHQLIYH